MKNRLDFLRSAIVSGIILFGAILMPAVSWAADFTDWNHGASGYNDVFQAAIDAESPLILYFHTEWCKWSKKMNNDYLASETVMDFLRDIPKVEINPDKGAEEKALAKQYSVSGFPSFLVFVPSADTKTERIHPFKKGTDWTPDEFVGAVRTKLMGMYNRKGYSCYQSQQYEESIRYYEKAIGFNPEDAYAYYGTGIVYHTVAYQNRDTAMLEAAEENYLKALEIDPDHTGSKKELEKLRKAMQELGIR